MNAPGDKPSASPPDSWATNQPVPRPPEADVPKDVPTPAALITVPDPVSPILLSRVQQDLLSGLLALVNHFIDAGTLVAVLGRHQEQPPPDDRSLLDILRDQGFLSGQHVHDLEKAGADLLVRHRGDLDRALASIPLSNHARLELDRLPDPLLHDLLVQMGSTIPPSAGADGAGSLPQPAVVRTRFQVLRPHAQGGIGQVSLARDEELERDVALKEIQPRFANEPQFRGRFLREARLTGRLEHPGIVPVYGMGLGPDGQPFYAMRFIKGQSLKEAIHHFHAPVLTPQDPGARLLELRQLLNRFIAVCNTLAYAHSKGVIHRDLKPDNIMLGPFGETLVVDWGLAKILDQPEDGSLILTPAALIPGAPDTETEMGTVVGTPSYMSPEQASGRLDLLGPASDVYSLGSTLYHLLTGQQAFQGPKGLVLEAVRCGSYTPPCQVDPQVPAALDAITRKAMALKPQDRYASASDLADDLERWLADEPVRALPESWMQRLARLGRRHRGVTRSVGVSAAVLLVVLTWTLILVSQARNREHRQYTINTLTRDLDARRAVADWTPEQLREMEELAQKLEVLDPEAAATARKRTQEECARAMREALMAPVLDAARRTLIADNLRWLEASGHAGAKELQEILKGRGADWNTVFKLVPPFDFKELARVFDRQRLRSDGQALFAQAPAGEKGPLLQTRLPSAGNIQLEATFAPSWTSAPVLGLLLNASADQSYRFLVSVPEYRPGQHDSQLARLANLDSTRKNGVPVKISIIRNDVLLREQQVLTVPDGPLRLQARRVGERLSFQVNQLEPLLFDDPFPLPPAKAGVFGVYWPAAAGLVQLEASHQARPDLPSPLERGDELFAQGEYREAEKFYREQAKQAAERAVRQEARFKQGLTLKELGQKTEALGLWQQVLMDDIPTGQRPARLASAAPHERVRRAVALLERNQPLQARQQLQSLLTEQSNAQADNRNRWLLLAACQIWLVALEEGDRKQAEQVQDRLTGVFRFEKLVALIPAEVRKPILDNFRLRGPRWRVPLGSSEDLETLKKAIQIEELINESPYERRMTRWRLSEQYRMENNLDLALLEITELLKEDLPLDERLAFVRESVWLLIERQKPAEALPRVNALLEGQPNNQAVLPLLLERARILAAQQRWPEAAQEVEDFFARADKQQLHYADWAEGCLLRGFLRRQQGDVRGAQQAWRQGLPRDFPGGIPQPPRGRILYGLADDRVDLTLRGFSQLASLTGEMTKAESNFLFNAAASTVGDRLTPAEARLAVLVSKDTFRPEFTRKLLLSLYRSPRGEDLARRITLRQISFKGYYLEMVQLMLAEGLHHTAYPTEPLPEGLEPLFWQGAGRLLDVYCDNRLDLELSRDLLKVWKGKDDPLGTWKEVSPHLGPDLRLLEGFALGRRFLVLGRLEVALPLLREVVANSRPDNLFHRLARAELDQLAGRIGSAVGQAGGLPHLWPVGWVSETLIKADKLKVGGRD